MSCIRYLFGKPKNKRADSERYSISMSLDAPLPQAKFELQVLEEHLGRRMSFVNSKASIAFANASYAHQKGDMLRYLRYMNERKQYADEVRKISARLTEVVARLNEFKSLPEKVERIVPNPLTKAESCRKSFESETGPSMSLR